MYQYYVWYVAWWWLNELKHVVKILIGNIIYEHMLCLLTD
jgi:hypothetical protein